MDAGEAEELAAISGVLRGNREAFRLLVERHKRGLFRLSFSYLGDRAEAEEATQEIFLRAFRYLHRFSLERRFAPWLYGIAVNYLRTHYKKLRRKREQLASQAADPPTEGISDPLEILQTAQTREAIRAAVAALPAALREPLILHYYSQLSVEEICAILGLGEENVKSRLQRARRKLREILAGGATPPEAAKYK